MKKIICSKCEYYYYDAENDDKYCTTQLPGEMISAYANCEIDELPKLIPQTKCRKFRKAKILYDRKGKKRDWHLQ
ncbi:MAG: hypothetical protein FWD71_04315 [Oscillospiraceae bacterium]|nr:hypothetical protein [Oscillospiraceae bacterium]